MTRDTPSLWLARLALREAYARIDRLPRADPAIGCVLDMLDAECCTLTVEMDAREPELELST